MPPPVEILFEDNHLLVVNKPAGIPTMGVEEGQLTMARWAADYLKRKYHKPGNVYVGIVSRLDRLVSGVLILARTSKAAGRLSEQIRQRTTEKRYLAIVASNARQAAPHFASGADWTELHSRIRKNEALQRMECVSAGQAGADAHLRFRVAARTQLGQRLFQLLEIELETGRKHQIRIQLADLGWPILGDAKYGSEIRLPNAIALHCHQLTVRHPTRQEACHFEASAMPHWKKLGKVVPAELLQAAERVQRTS